MIFWMRKHMKIILWSTLIIVVPTFIAVGVSSKNRGRDVERALTVLASVGGVPITREQYLNRLNMEVRRRAQYGQHVTMDDLVFDGTAETLLEGLIDAALINIEVERMSPGFTHEFLVERLKDAPDFKDEAGNFNAALWNDWVSADYRQDWNAIYAGLAEQAAREMLLAKITAPARVLDQEVREEFEKNFTKYQVKYLHVNPKINLTDEQIQKQYDENPSRYEAPEKRSVEFVGVSLRPPRPEILVEIIRKARAGEDFAALAAEYSHHPQAADTGGAVGWFSPADTLPDHLSAALQMEVGEVGGPFHDGDAYYVSMIDEQREDAETGEVEKHVRQIVIRPSLTEEERLAAEAKAEEFMFKALQIGFSEAAAEMALDVRTADGVSTDSFEIDGMPSEDVRTFTTGIETIPADGMSGVIDSIRHLYVVQVREVTPPELLPLEMVREDVKQDAEVAVRRSEEHAERVREATDQIVAQARRLDEAVGLLPDLELEVELSEPFSQGDFLFTQGIMLQTHDVLHVLRDRAPGEIAGPVYGFGGQAYLFEIVSRTPPSDEAWTTEFPREEIRLRDQMLATRQSELLMDYVAALRERTAAATPILRDANAISDALGLNRREVVEQQDEWLDEEEAAAQELQAEDVEPEQDEDQQTAS